MIPTFLKQFISVQAEEITKTKTLYVFGFLLVFIHLVSLRFMGSGAFSFLQGEHSALCWPFWSSCFLMRAYLSKDIILIFLSVYGLMIAVNFYLLIKRKLYLFWWAFLILNVIKYILLIQDYRFMGNYHYMPFVISFVFLFISNKIKAVQFFLVAFYLSAGLLKLNPEWLSGAALGSSRLFNAKLFEFGLAGVVYLELIFVFGLLSKSMWWRYVALTSFILFHAISYVWVGHFYPVVMLSLLTIFPLNWHLPNDAVAPWTYTFRGVWISLFLFWLGQAVTALYPGDATVTGETRIVSLNMYDSRTECDDLTILKYKNHVNIEVSVKDPRLAVRIHCDPAVYWTKLKQLCHEKSFEKDFIDLDFHWKGRRKTDVTWKATIEIKDFCQSQLAFNMVVPNSWIKNEINR